MKTASLFVLSVLHAVASITAVTVTNGTVTSYDPAELLSKIFNSNTSAESRQRGYGLIKFEDQPDPNTDPDGPEPGQYGLYDPGQRPLRFEDDYDQKYHQNDYNSQSEGTIKFQDSEDNLSSNNGGVTFQDDNRVEDQGNKKKRKRRRRRKPKNGVLPYPGSVGSAPGRPGVDGVPGAGRPGYRGPFQAGYGQNSYPGYPVQPFRRPRRPRPKPSLATEALSSITEALTSIARYDDYQCVPRLLCEAAGGGALSNNGVLQSIAGIQPLLTLLSAYNGISTSPLFVFGRAVFLGMTTKGNTGTCRYAYPQCPTDPEQLIYYLNNHNGGFFRFFNAPQAPNQNLEQFYNQLGNQGFGIYQPQQNPAQQSYGYPNDHISAQNYGLNQNNQNYQYPNSGGYDYQNNEHNYGPQRPGAYDRPSLYNNQNYSPNYANGYNYGSGNQIRFKDSNARIEKRIQNKPTQNLAEDSFEDDDVRTKWQFPDDQSSDFNNNNYNVRDSRTLKFPDEGQSYNDQKDSTRKGKQVYFPNNKNSQNYYNNQQHVFSNNNNYQTTTYSYNNGQSNQNDYTNRPNTYINNNNYKPAIPYQNHDYNPNNNNNKYNNHQNYYNNRQNIYNNNQKYQPNTIFNNEEYVFDHKHNFYVKKESNNNYSNTNQKDYNYSNNGYNTNQKEYNYSNSAYNTNRKENNNYYNNAYDTNNFKRNEDNGIKTVYVVRGNGDPNRPEIVKLRPGQSIH